MNKLFIRLSILAVSLSFGVSAYSAIAGKCKATAAKQFYCASVKTWYLLYTSETDYWVPDGTNMPRQSGISTSCSGNTEVYNEKKSITDYCKSFSTDWCYKDSNSNSWQGSPGC